MFLAQKNVWISDKGSKVPFCQKWKIVKMALLNPCMNSVLFSVPNPIPLNKKKSSHLWATPTKTTTDDNHVRWSSAPVQIPGEKHRLTLLHHNEISNSCANYEWWVLVVTQETTWLGTCPFYFTAMQYHCTVKQPNSRHAKKCILPKNIQTKYKCVPKFGCLTVWPYKCTAQWSGFINPS